MSIVSWYSQNQIFDENEVDILNQFYAFMQADDIKSVRYLLRTYDVFNKLDSRRLNFLFHIPGYKFTKRNNQLTLYKPVDLRHKNLSPESESEDNNETLQTSLLEQIPNSQITNTSNNLDLELFNNLKQEILQIQDSLQKQHEEHNRSTQQSSEINNQFCSKIDQIELKVNEIVNVINSILFQMNESKINKTTFGTINYEPEKEGEKALNYLKSQRKSKYPGDPVPLSAHATFQPNPNIKRPKNTTEEFFKQHPELQHLLKYVNKSTD